MKKTPAKKRALNKFKRTETARGRKQDKARKANTVGIKKYDPKQNDYEGVDTPKKRVRKSAPKKDACKRKTTSNPWLAHLKRVRPGIKKCHPDWTIGQIAKEAAKSYKK